MNINKLLPNLPSGHYHPKGLQFLAKLISMTKGLKGGYLEVGSLAGRSSVVIGLEAKGNGDQLFCIDIWDSGEWAVIADEIGVNVKRYPERPKNIYNIFKDNMKKFGLQNMVFPIMDRSENVLKKWSKPLKFIHIDGCHEYEFVKIDTGWKNHLVKDGIICFHDYDKSWKGVKKAINESFYNDNRFRGIGLAASLLAFRRL